MEILSFCPNSEENTNIVVSFELNSPKINISYHPYSIDNTLVLPPPLAEDSPLLITKGLCPKKLPKFAKLYLILYKCQSKRCISIMIYLFSSKLITRLTVNNLVNFSNPPTYPHVQWLSFFSFDSLLAIDETLLPFSPF